MKGIVDMLRFISRGIRVAGMMRIAVDRRRRITEVLSIKN